MLAKPTKEDLLRYTKINQRIDDINIEFNNLVGIKSHNIHPTRRWEYPWVLEQLIKLYGPDGPTSIVEAGCGGTLFPYLLAKDFPNCQVFAVDDFDSIGYWGLPKNLDLYNSLMPNLQYIRANLISNVLSGINGEVVISIGVLEHVADNYTTSTGHHTQFENLIETTNGRLYKKAQVKFIDNIKHIPNFKYFICTMDSHMEWQQRKFYYDYLKIINESSMSIVGDETKYLLDNDIFHACGLEVVGFILK